MFCKIVGHFDYNKFPFIYLIIFSTTTSTIAKVHCWFMRSLSNRITIVLPANYFEFKSFDTFEYWIWPLNALYAWFHRIISVHLSSVHIGQDLHNTDTDFLVFKCKNRGNFSRFAKLICIWLFALLFEIYLISFDQEVEKCVRELGQWNKIIYRQIVHVF